MDLRTDVWEQLCGFHNKAISIVVLNISASGQGMEYEQATTIPKKGAYQGDQAKADVIYRT